MSIHNAIVKWLLLFHESFCRKTPAKDIPLFTFEDVDISLYQIPSAFTLFLTRARSHNTQVGVCGNSII